MEWLAAILITTGAFCVFTARFPGIYAPARKALRCRAPKALTQSQVLQNQLAEKIEPLLELDPIERSQTEALLRNLGHSESPELFHAQALAGSIFASVLCVVFLLFSVPLGVVGMAIFPEKSYPGFTMTPDSVTASTSTNIDGDGTTLLKLYYDRNVNTVTYTYSGETDVTPPALPTQATYRYGQTVTLSAAPTLPGYDFGSWETSDVTVTDGSFTMASPAIAALPVTSSQASSNPNGSI